MSDGWDSDDGGATTEVRAASPPPPRGGGRGRGGGGSACYKCNQEGHISRECPNADSLPRPPRTCNKCHEEGHMARECPNGGGGGGGGSCYNCGEEGHMSKECTQERRGGGGGGGGDRGRGCFNCGQEGHQSKDCTEERREGGGGGRGRGCFNCGQEGHQSKDCTEERREGGGGGGGKSRGCFNCGEEGHMSKDCTNERREDVDRPPRKDGALDDDPTKERYTPPEMLEGDQMFEERKKIYDSAGINFKAYDNIPFQITGTNAVPSVNTFEELKLRPLILGNLKRVGYSEPTPIQKHGSPQLMAGSHVMCCAQTGSGKTAAFLLPIINQLMAMDDLTPACTSPATPEALILAPTRELAIQIANEANMYANDSMVKTQLVYGGAAIFAQKNRLMRGCNILVATTGRLKQFLKEGLVSLSKVQFFILDEADRMLDMGFMPDVDEIVEQLPPKEDRVSGMFSATFPQEIQTAAKKYLHDYIFIVIGVVGGACKEVQQEFLQVEKSEKKKKVLEILRNEGNDTKVVVFCASKKGADFLATHLATNGVSCTSIHGDRLQSQRETALREFKLGQRMVLVATAVAARGLDIPKVGLVINYDLPNEIDEYVHRIGRTGRVGRSGKAISFYDPDQDSALTNSLVSILKGAGQEVPDFLSGCSNGYGGIEEGDFTSTDMRSAKSGSGMANGSANAEEEEW